jgi:hypothetical protein
MLLDCIIESLVDTQLTAATAAIDNYLFTYLLLSVCEILLFGGL